VQIHTHPHLPSDNFEITAMASRFGVYHRLFVTSVVLTSILFLNVKHVLQRRSLNNAIPIHGYIRYSSGGTGGKTPTSATTLATSSAATVVATTQGTTQGTTTNEGLTTSPSVVQNTTLPYVPTKTVWANAHKDRSGAAIIAMISQHALAFRNGWKLGGICGYTFNKETNEEALRALGLDSILFYACPDQSEEKNAYFIEDSELKLAQYASSPTWRDYMKRAASLPPPARTNVKTGKDEDIFRVAVHIRRGDVSLCSGNAWRRYSPNSHFLRTIDWVMQNVTHPNVQITIYTNPPGKRQKLRQYETLDVFRERGYIVDEGESSVSETLVALLRADVTITSRSTFPIVPSVLKLGQGRVVATAFKHFTPLPGWEMVPLDFMHKMVKDMETFQQKICPENGTETDRERYLENPEFYLGLDCGYGICN